VITRKIIKNSGGLTSAAIGTTTLVVDNVVPTLSDTSLTDMNGVPTTIIIPEKRYLINFTVQDNNSIEDINSIIIRIFYDEMTNPDKTNCYNFTYVQSDNSWASLPDGYIISSTAPTDHNISSFKFSLSFKLDKTAIQSNAWHLNIDVVDDAGDVVCTSMSVSTVKSIVHHDIYVGGGGGPSLAAAVASNIKAGKSVSLKLDTSYSALSRVVVTAKEDIPTILITAEKTALPKSIKAPEKNVYQYIEVTPYKLTDASVAQAILDFDIKKSWLDQNGYGIGDIVMMRYHDGEWQHLTTEFVKEANGRVYYRALSPGLSYFAIAYAEGGTVVPEETPVIPVPVEAAPTAAQTAVATTAAPAEPSLAALIPGFGAFVTLIALGAGACFAARRY